MAQLEIRPRAVERTARRLEIVDVFVWLGLVAAGLAVAAVAVIIGADLGTDAPPFLLYYRIDVTLGAVAAALVAGVVLWTAAGRLGARCHWGRLLGLSYVASVAWMLSLALAHGTDGLRRYVTNEDGYTPDTHSFGSISEILTALNDAHGPDSTAAIGHPPGPVIVLWALHSAGLSPTATGLVWTLAAAATVPVALQVARSFCGRAAARRLAPVFVLAPYAIWMAVGPDAITALLGACALGAATFASHRNRRGWLAVAGAVAAGVLLAAATMFGYIAAWLGLSMVCLYFARRRAWHNLATGLGVVGVVAVIAASGFDWADGLTTAYHGFLDRVGDGRSAGWWIPLSLAVVVLACGPPIVASARKCRNTPAWPLLVGACAAVLFSIAAGTARGGVEETWLPFFPWLTIAATAPRRPGGPPQPAPWRLVAGGSVAAVLIQALLISPW